MRLQAALLGWSCGPAQIYIQDLRHYAGHRQLEEARAQLEPRELARAAAFRTEALARRWLLGRWLTKAILARELGQELTQIGWQVSASGKPVHPQRSFSISRTGPYLAVITGPPKLLLGIDCEGTNSAHTHLPASSAALAVFHPSDRVVLRQSETGYRDFLRLWTRLEAAVKATGQGLGSAGHYPVNADRLELAPQGAGLPGQLTLATRFLEPALPLVISWALSSPSQPLPQHR